MGFDFNFNQSLQICHYNKARVAFQVKFKFVQSILGIFKPHYYL